MSTSILNLKHPILCSIFLASVSAGLCGVSNALAVTAVAPPAASPAATSIASTIPTAPVAAAVAPQTSTVSPKIAAVAPTAPATSTNSAEFSVPQVKKIEQIAHDYMVKNPQVIIEAVQELQKQEQQEAQKRYAEIKDNSQKHVQEIFATKPFSHPAIGSSKPQIIIAEFLSYQCPNCRATEPAIDELLKKNQDVQIMFILWPFEGEGDVYAARFALASQKQGKFRELHSALLNAPGMLTHEGVKKMAQDLKLDMVKLKQDLKDPNIDNELKANFKLAQQLNLIGAPAIFVTNSQLSKMSLIPGRATIEDFTKAISEVR